MGTSVCVQTTILHEMQCIHFQKWHLSKMPTRIWYSWDLLIFSAASRENQCRIIGNYKSAWYNIFIKCILYTLGFIYSTFAVDKWYENLANAYYLWAGVDTSIMFVLQKIRAKLVPMHRQWPRELFFSIQLLWACAVGFASYFTDITSTSMLIWKNLIVHSFSEL